MENIGSAPVNTQISPVVEQIGIPPLPDYIFKYRKNRQAPAQDVWGKGTITYIPERAAYIYGEGNFVYYRGVPFPSKTVAPVEAIYAIGGVKRSILMDLYLFESLATGFSRLQRYLLVLAVLVMGKERRSDLLNKYFQLFIDKHDIVLVNFYLYDGYYCKIVRELRGFVQTFLMSLGVEEKIAVKVGEIVGMLFEYDNAYRCRVQDLLNEISMEAWGADFPNELRRLIEILASREAIAGGGEHIVRRFESALAMIKYLWKIPFIKKALQKSIRSINLENCKLDEADIYHTLLFGDYNVQGKPIEERMKILEGYHGPDPAKWPPRIMIKSR